MVAAAAYYEAGENLDFTPSADVAAGSLVQLPDSRAAVSPVAIASGKPGAVRVCGVIRLQKTASINILNGGRVFWDNSASLAHFKSVGDRDFYAGVAVGDSLATQTYVDVALNVHPAYKLDLVRDGYNSTPVGTAVLNGFGYPYREGGSLRFNITATNEAQKVDAISVEGLIPGANPIVEMAFRMPNGGSGSASDFSLGLADGTHASDADQIANSIFVHMDGGALLINAECDDGTNETAATSTGVSFVAGSNLSNRVEVWIDCRDRSSLKFYVDGVRVASGTTFSVAAMTATMFLLAHMEKSIGTETANMIVDWLRARIAS